MSSFAAHVRSWDWWRDLAERLARQAAQTAVPIIGTVSTGTGAVDPVTLLSAVALAEVVTFGKAALQAVVGWRVPEGAPALIVLADRALPAAAGTLLALWPETGPGLLDVQWDSVGHAAVWAAIIASVAAVVAPPGARLPSKDSDVEDAELEPSP